MKTEEAKCESHCSKCCKNEPELSFLEGIIGVPIVLSFIVFVAVFALSLPVGVINGIEGEKCGNWFEHRYNFVLPLYQVGCNTGIWLKQDTHPKKED